MRPAVGRDGDLCAYAIAVRPRADGFYSQHVVLISVVVSQQPGESIVGGNHQIQVAVVVEISVGGATSYNWLLQRGPDFRRYFFELVFPEVAEKMRRLRILDVGLHYADVVGNVSVHRENILQAIEIIIKKESAEGKRLRRYPADSSSRRFICKQT